MTAFLFTLFFTALFMWLFFKFMYPKPPKAFMPKEGDIITARDCDFCGYPLAEYRGVLETKPQSALSPAELDSINDLSVEHNGSKLDNPAHSETYSEQEYKALSRQQRKVIDQARDKQQQEAYQQQQAVKKKTTWFFCNYEHQTAFHAQQQTVKEDAAKQSPAVTSTDRTDA